MSKPTRDITFPWKCGDLNLPEQTSRQEYIFSLKDRSPFQYAAKHEAPSEDERLVYLPPA